LAFHILKNRNHKTNLVPIVEDILSLDSSMRFVAIIDLKGNISEAIMKKGKTSLKSQKEEEHFCKQVALGRRMRNEFNKSLGKVNYVHIERERVTQIVVYPKRKTIYVTLEPKLNMERKMELVHLIKKKTAHL